jgi:hypothetical protein
MNTNDERRKAKNRDAQRRHRKQVFPLTLPARSEIPWTEIESPHATGMTVRSKMAELEEIKKTSPTGTCFKSTPPQISNSPNLHLDQYHSTLETTPYRPPPMISEPQPHSMMTAQTQLNVSSDAIANTPHINSDIAQTLNCQRPSSSWDTFGGIQNLQVGIRFRTS